MSPREQVLQLLRGALTALEAERTVINDLNVYPVPDGDTGTNLFLTVRAVLEEVERGAAADRAELAALVTKGSLMGARGNSGVILSQIVRGVCEAWAISKTIGTREVKRALERGAQAAYRAVRQPVEGTMLTVMREMAEAARACEDGAQLTQTLQYVSDQGALAVERTREQLDVLRRAGVVDAGGYGLLVIFRGLAAAATGEQQFTAPTAATESIAAQLHDHPALSAAAHGSELSRYRYCTSFLLRGERLSRDEMEEFIAGCGDSWLVVGDVDMLKVHVHTDDPGVVLSHAVARGALAGVEIADMHEQTRERDARLVAVATDEATDGTAVVAVAAGAGNKELFRALGCGAVVDGGQSMNPSAAQLLQAVEGMASEEVILLPNNGNVVLTAEQAAGMSERHVAVVPTTSMPEGLSALVAFDPAQDAVTNALAMEQALRGVRSAEITQAVRDSEVDGVAVSKGQAMGLVDGHLVAAGDDLLDVFARVLDALAEAAPEIVTVLTSLDGFALTAADLERVAAEHCPGVELAFHEGGQPLYPILAAAE